MRTLARWRRGIVLAVALGIFFLLTQSAWIGSLPLAERAEGFLLDRRFQVREFFAPTAPHPGIALVAIGNQAPLASDFRPEELAESEALRLMTERAFPWNRKVFALLLDRLFALGARAVALDILFLTPREGDEELRAALEKYRGRVVIGWTGEEQGETNERHELAFRHPSPTVLGDLGTSASAFVFHHADIDGVMRRVDYRTSELREMGRDPMGADLLGFAALAVHQAASREAPAGFRRPINFQGGHATYPHLPIEEVFLERVVQESPLFGSGQVFRDKLVFVGPTANSFHDTFLTPFGEMTGVELHAHVAGDLMCFSTLEDLPAPATRWVVLACALLPALVVLGIRGAALQTALLGVLAGALLGGAQLFFNDSRLVVPMVPPLAALFGTGGFGIVFQWLLEQAERHRLRGVLNVHLSKNVADLILSERDTFEESLRGKTRMVTVLFSDIRSFTSWSETAPPTQLVAQLNEYFEGTVDPILTEDGTLQRFIGDAILAAWGDTHSRGGADDATRAVRAALGMRAALVRLNAGWHGRADRRQLTSGIGLNHGEATVGQVGHTVRRDFTVLGDAINLAARFESATKQFHADILVGASVEALTRTSFRYRRVDSLVFKGKKLPVEVFIPLSEMSVAAPVWLEPYHRAIDLYRARRFSDAAALFRTVEQQIEGGDFLCRMYAERCDRFAQSPPPADWDGSHTLTEK